jgi:hypothetical protein
MNRRIIAAPWLTLRMTLASSGLFVGEMAKCNAAGRRTAMTLIVSKDELSCVEVTPKPCSENRVPPAKKQHPRTRSRLLRIDPTRED